jgi:excisionase family DNA binding protein
MTKTAGAQPLPPSGLLTVDEIAAELRVDVVTVRRWITDGHLSPAYKVGRAYRVPRASLDQFIGHRTVAPR